MYSFVRYIHESVKFDIMTYELHIDELTSAVVIYNWWSGVPIARQYMWPLC